MIDNGVLNNLALYEQVMEHRDELLREAEKERLVRLAMSGRKPRKSLINRWMNFLGKNWPLWEQSLRRNLAQVQRPTFCHR